MLALRMVVASGIWLFPMSAMGAFGVKLYLSAMLTILIELSVMFVGKWSDYEEYELTLNEITNCWNQICAPP